MAFDTEYDLVVVGGGASGKSAALEAARAGKSVVILEKMPETGGLSMFAEGTAAFESSEQKKLGKPAHPDRHFPTKQEGYDKFNSYSHYGDADENPTQIREIWRSACTRGKTSLRQSSSS